MLFIPIHNILNFLNPVNKIKGVKKSNARVGLSGIKAFTLKNGGLPAKRAGSEGGQKFLVDVHSPTPFLFARPSVRFLPRGARQSVRVLLKIGSSFVQ